MNSISVKFPLRLDFIPCLITDSAVIIFSVYSEVITHICCDPA